MKKREREREIGFIDDRLDNEELEFAIAVYSLKRETARLSLRMLP